MNSDDETTNKRLSTKPQVKNDQKIAQNSTNVDLAVPSQDSKSLLLKFLNQASGEKPIKNIVQ